MWLHESATEREHKYNEIIYASVSRLECSQPPWLKIAQTTAINRVQPVSIGCRYSTGSRSDHMWIDEAAL
jgi:hypothetical protein